MTWTSGFSAAKPSAMPQIKPPPPTGTKTRSTSGRSARISGTIDEWPVITMSFANGWMNTSGSCSHARAAIHSSRRSRGSCTGVAPRARTPSSLRAGAVSYIITRHGTPSDLATYAQASAALPALTVRSPRATRSRSKRWAAAKKPRTLKLPVGCCDSSFTYPPDGVGINGVWRMWGARSRATSCTAAASTPAMAVTGRPWCQPRRPGRPRRRSAPPPRPRTRCRWTCRR